MRQRFWEFGGPTHSNMDSSWMNLTQMQSNVEFGLLSRVTGGQNVQIKFWENQGGTSRNRCTQRLVILHTQTHERTLIAHQKLGHPDLLYSSKSQTDKTEQAFASQLSFTTHGLLVNIVIGLV